MRGGNLKREVPMGLYVDILQELELENQATGYGYDQALSAKLHRAIDADEMLPVVSKNIQMVVDHGVVTLMGEVFSNEERKIIARKAAACAGYENVINELE